MGNPIVMTNFYLFVPPVPIQSGQSQTKVLDASLVINDLHTPAQTFSLQIVLPNSFTFLTRIILPLLPKLLSMQ